VETCITLFYWGEWIEMKNSLIKNGEGIAKKIFRKNAISCLVQNFILTYGL
jgi:hypothetical protein